MTDAKHCDRLPDRQGSPSPLPCVSGLRNVTWREPTPFRRACVARRDFFLFVFFAAKSLLGGFPVALFWGGFTHSPNACLGENTANNRSATPISKNRTSRSRARHRHHHVYQVRFLVQRHQVRLHRDRGARSRGEFHLPNRCLGDMAPVRREQPANLLAGLVAADRERLLPLSISGQDTTYLHAILLNSSSADA
jgi:hypothetical protein